LSAAPELGVELRHLDPRVPEQATDVLEIAVLLVDSDFRIAEDVIGQGHLTREVDREPRVSVFVPLG
jgi:hypothetical protein